MNLVKNRSNVITYSVDKAVNHNLYISVQNGEVVVKAPWYLSQTEIQNIVEEKKKWILVKLKEYEKNREKRKQENTIEIFGKIYKVNLCYQKIKAPTLDLEEQNVNIAIPYQYKENTRNVLEIIFHKLYTMLAEKEIEMIMEKTRILLGFAPEDYKIEKVENTLAKCEDRKIIINPEVVKYKKEIVEYIVLHEFCHLRYKTHSKKFYSMLKKYMPNYEVYAAEINHIKY